MNEVIDPKANPELAAQQIIIELIRAKSVGEMSGATSHKNVDTLLSIHSKIVTHYKNMK
ncbi:hypothetical protein M2263_000083 [Providencia alcalifaciens]|nr:hypothetical protein [Providencia alcalifaciens]